MPINKQFFAYYDSNHQNKTNQLIHFIGANVLVAFCISAVIFKMWWLIPVGIFLAYLIPHWGHVHFEKNGSMRGAHPMGCIVGNARMFFRTFKRLTGISKTKKA